LRHAPAPSQSPSKPHVVAASAMHSSWGSLPAAMGPHTPSAPCSLRSALHAMQVPLQSESQQTPSTQYPVRHSLACVQGQPAATHSSSDVSLSPAATSTLPLGSTVADGAMRAVLMFELVGVQASGDQNTPS